QVFVTPKLHSGIEFPVTDPEEIDKLIEALEIAEGASYLEQTWFKELDPIHQEMCRKNPTEDLEWRNEAFEDQELPVDPQLCRSPEFRRRVENVLIAQQGSRLTGAAPHVLIWQPGVSVKETIDKWELETQNPELNRSEGTIEPVILQAITRTFDPSDASLWVPPDQ
ncbi:MAG: hypothetical protein GY924_23590, partial [Planctomycetaceae bacterium]|nr:hypothetical protein [Planctomycetaceae bacterium]